MSCRSIRAKLCAEHGCPATIVPFECTSMLAVGTWDGYFALYLWKDEKLLLLASKRLIDSGGAAVSCIVPISPSSALAVSGESSGIFYLENIACTKTLRCTKLPVGQKVEERRKKGVKRKRTVASITAGTSDQDESRVLPALPTAAGFCGSDTLCLASEDGELWIYDFDQAGRKLLLRSKLELHDGRISSMIFVVPKRLAFLASEDGSFSVVNTRDAKCVARSKAYDEDIEAMALLHGLSVDTPSSFSSHRLIVATNTGRVAAHKWDDWGHPVSSLLPRVHDKQSVDALIVLSQEKSVVASLADGHVVRLLLCAGAIQTGITPVETVLNSEHNLTGLVLCMKEHETTWLAAMITAEPELMFIGIPDCVVDTVFTKTDNSAAECNSVPAASDNGACDSANSTPLSDDLTADTGAGFYDELD